MARGTSKSTPESELLLAVRTLTDQVRVLRDAMDELREEVQWANQNRGFESVTVRQMQDGPLYRWNSQFAVNLAAHPKSEAQQSQPTASPSNPGRQGELFA